MTTDYGWRLREFRRARREAMQELGRIAHREAIVTKLLTRLGKNRESVVDRIATIDWSIRNLRAKLRAASEARE